MTVSETPLPGVLVFETRVFGDDRGYLVETFRASTYGASGCPYSFVQDNLSVSRHHVLRGLHLQHPNGQAKLVYAVEGCIWDVCVDVRVGSPTFGQWYGLELSAESGRQLLIPTGFAHGFCVLSERAAVAYKCSDYYSPDAQITLAWNDPVIGITWPVGEPLLSPKDAAGELLADLAPVLPRYEA